jgi:hypothetical protein
MARVVLDSGEHDLDWRERRAAGTWLQAVRPGAELSPVAAEAGAVP